MTEQKQHRVFTMKFGDIYPFYVAKAERKGRTKAEVDQIICWLTGHTTTSLQKTIQQQVDMEHFFADAPQLHKNRKLITGVVCGVRVEEIGNTTMRHIRYLDKLIDELAKGKPLDKIFR